MVSLKKYLRALTYKLVLVLFVTTIASCKEDFKDVDASSIRVKLEESIKHTAVSWWYIGEENEYYYIVEKWPFEQYRYKVSKKEISINIKPPKKLNTDKSTWINLKIDNIVFK